MLQVQNLSKRYGEKTAVNDVSFTVPDGKVTGFLGPNGAGKTTLLRSILGLVPHKGNITLSIPSNEIAVHMQQNSYIETVPIRVIIEMIMGCRINENPKLVEMIKFF